MDGGHIVLMCCEKVYTRYDRLTYDCQVGARQETRGTQSVSRVRLLSRTY